MNASQARFRFSFRHERAGMVELISGEDFRLRPVGFGEFDLPQLLPGKLVDLLRIAMAGFMADELTPRPRRAGHYRPVRSLDVGVEVWEPDFWNDSSVSQLLREARHFLTDDDWCIRFIADPSKRQREFQLHFDFFDPSVVCLYSDGLDSAAGLAARLKDPPKELVIPVTVWQQSGLAKLACQQIGMLCEHYGLNRSHIQPLVVQARPIKFRLRERGLECRRAYHRCRPFLFAAVGGVVAALTHAKVVEVCESGIGAINLPLMAGMVGSMATRGSHPRFLRLMSELVRRAADRKVEFKLPWLWQTKGDMVSRLAKEGLNELARSTASCVSYPWHTARRACGVCPGCLFRRLALFEAGIEEPPGTYRFDLFGPPEDVNGIPAKRLDFLRAFLMQAAKLRDLDVPGRLPACLRDHLIDTGVVAAGEPLAPYAKLFRRYRHEWLRLTAHGRAQGWDWSEWLAPKEVTAA